MSTRIKVAVIGYGKAAFMHAEALKNIPPSEVEGPLISYFKGEEIHGSNTSKAGIFEANMYLAEDRILCFEIAFKRDKPWKLKYVKVSVFK